MARITIEDLPQHEGLSPEEMDKLTGGFRLQIFFRDPRSGGGGSTDPTPRATFSANHGGGIRYPNDRRKPYSSVS